LILIDFEERLIALNDEATTGVVWNGVEWAQIGGDFPRKAWLEGEEIGPEEAAKRFPEADLTKMPELGLIQPQRAL
jgi:hypothetical protein